MDDYAFSELSETVRQGIAEAFMIPDIDEQKLAEIKRLLHRAMTCPICGQPKVHYRLYGYRCHNPEHAEMEARGNHVPTEKREGL